MKILVDTCIWSQVWRKKTPNVNLTKQLKDFIGDGRVVMIGPIRQELLSGIPSPSQFNKLKHTLSFFEDILLKTDHFVKAAEFSNLCRKNGIQGSTTDFLICAVANLEKLSIFTVDSDFINYNKHLKIKLIKWIYNKSVDPTPPPFAIRLFWAHCLSYFNLLFWCQTGLLTSDVHPSFGGANAGVEEQRLCRLSRGEQVVWTDNISEIAPHLRH